MQLEQWKAHHRLIDLPLDVSHAASCAELELSYFPALRAPGRGNENTGRPVRLKNVGLTFSIFDRPYAKPYGATIYHVRNRLVIRWSVACFEGRWQRGFVGGSVQHHHDVEVTCRPR